MHLWTYKKTTVPKTNETKEVDAVQLWIVKWLSRYDQYSSSTKTEFEAFTDENKANEFAQSLRNAFKLIRHTSDTNVIVYKQKEIK